MIHQHITICINIGHGHNYFMNLLLIYPKSSFFSQEKRGWEIWNNEVPFSTVVLKRGTFFLLMILQQGQYMCPYLKEKKQKPRKQKKKDIYSTQALCDLLTLLYIFLDFSLHEKNNVHYLVMINSG